MHRRVVGTLLLNDLRLLLRSGRTLFMSVVLPLLLFPVVLLISNIATQRQIERREETVYQYAVVGVAAAEARTWIERTRRRLESQSGDEPDFYFEEVRVEDAEKRLEEGELHFFVSARPPAAADPEEPRQTERASLLLEVHLRSDRDDSGTAGGRMQRELRATRREAWEDHLQRAGFPIPPDRLFAVEKRDVATAQQTAGLLLGRLLTTLLVTLLVSGGSVVAMDSLAGEKERGTLETLLTTAASRLELVTAKSLAIVIVGLVITVINIANLLVWIRLEVIPIPDGFAVPIDLPIGVLLLVLYMPVAALVSSLLLVVSGYARTYKEAQLLLFPVTVLCIAPTLVALLPGLELRSALAIVPIANIALAVKEVLTGTFHWPLLVLAWVSTVTAAALLARQSVRALSTERLITASDFDAAEFLGGAALLPRHILRWYASLWALFLLVQLNFGPPRSDVRVILLVNMGLFVGLTLAMIRIYRLDVRSALALRPVPWQIWLAVLLGVPSGAVLALGVGEISGFFFPIPESWLELFSEGLLPEDIPFWQMLLLLTLLPGVCEEIAFRGVLLYGLRRRLRPIALVATVGLVFGLFHVDLFRILPTAFLGAVLAAATLLSGSIFPAVVWHVLHNGLNLMAGQLAPDALTSPSRLIYLPALLVFVLALAIFWRWRRPYPEPATRGVSERGAASEW